MSQIGAAGEPDTAPASRERDVKKRARNVLIFASIESEGFVCSRAMAKHSHYRSNESEAALTFRVDAYPLLDHESSTRLLAEVERVVDTDRCRITCEMGEIRITRLTYDYATMVRFLLQGRRVLDGQCTLKEAP